MTGFVANPVGFNTREFENKRNLVLRGTSDLVNEETGEIVGTVDRTSGDVTATLVSERDYNAQFRDDFGNFGSSPETVQEQINDPITVRYTPDQASAASNLATFSKQIIAEEAGVEVNFLGLRSNLAIIPNTLRFNWGGQVYADNNGDLVRDPDGQREPAGTLNHNTGDARITAVPSNSSADIQINEGVVAENQINTKVAVFRTPGPQRPGSLIVQAVTVSGTQITATSDVNGDMSGDGITGTVDSQTGVAELTFPNRVSPGTITFSTVAFTSIPKDADLLGLNPVRLPQDGRVPIARSGDICVIHNTKTTDIGDGTQTTLRQRLTFVRVFDANGDRVPTADLNIDLDAGTVEVLASTSAPSPFTAQHRIEDMEQIAEVQITGQVSLAGEVTHDYPADESFLSTAVLYGDIQAGFLNVFSQVTWNDQWEDDLTADPTAAQFNTVDFPFQVDNEGAIQERWRAEFNTPTTVNIIGETIGQIMTDVPISSDIAPINPATNVPFFTIPTGGWGQGWNTGNQLRFNTTAANRPLWLVRTVTGGDGSQGTDEFQVQIRGDAN